MRKDAGDGGFDSASVVPTLEAPFPDFSLSLSGHKCYLEWGLAEGTFLEKGRPSTLGHMMVELG